MTTILRHVKIWSQHILCLLAIWPLCAMPASKDLIGTKPDSWRSASVFTHVIWRDLLFFGGSAGTGGGDPRHEMEIGVFRINGPDAGSFHPGNPIVTRAQFGLDRPGRGITPLSMFEDHGRLYLFCTARSGVDLHPRIAVIEAGVGDPFSWTNLTEVIGPELSGQANNHGVSVLRDPEDPTRLLVYFAARTEPTSYRILLAIVPVEEIMNPSAYRLLRGYENPVLSRENAKANYPFVRHFPDRKEYELWYSGQSIDDPRTRSIFVTRSKSKDTFVPAPEAMVKPSLDPQRNDAAYATGPKVHGGYLYYSGRRTSGGDYRGIFRLPVRELGNEAERR